MTRQLHIPRPMDVVLAGLAMVAIMAISGPFGTYDDLSLPVRFAYWALAITAIAPLMELAIAFSLRTNSAAGPPKWLRALIAVTLAAVPAAMLMQVIDHLFRPQYVLFGTFPITWLSIAVIGAFVGAFRYRHEIWGHRRDVAAPTSVDVAPATLPPFFKRLDGELGTDLVSLSINEHYLDVVTTRGKALLRMRLRDAVLELDGYPGAQIHRSHWVGKAHAGDVVRRGSGYQMRLADGRVLPVSRNRLKNARSLTAEH